jgi:hypothetical protein
MHYQGPPLPILDDKARITPLTLRAGATSLPVGSRNWKPPSDFESGIWLS